MVHEIIKEKLWMFYDPELSESDRKQIASHLESCRECRRALERWQKIQGVLSRPQDRPPSEVFVGEVMNRLAAPEAGREPGRASRQWELPQWLFPALGYGFAFFLMMVAIETRQAPVNTEAVLLADVPSSTQWTFAKEQPDVHQLWSSVKEDA